MGESADRSRLASLSDRLLGAIRRIRTLEERKRTVTISTPEFHQLADDIEDEGRRVFYLSAEERQVADIQVRHGDTIDDVARGDGYKG